MAKLRVMVQHNADNYDVERFIVLIQMYPTLYKILAKVSAPYKPHGGMIFPYLYKGNVPDDMTSNVLPL